MKGKLLDGKDVHGASSSDCPYIASSNSEVTCSSWKEPALFPTCSKHATGKFHRVASIQDVKQLNLQHTLESPNEYREKTVLSGHTGSHFL